MKAAAHAAPPVSVASLIETINQLHDLISALDRRVPQVQRAGESAIANAAVRLRIDAVKRIRELEVQIAGRQPDYRPTMS